MASQQVSCKQHPKAHLIEDYRAGDLICSECGKVVGDRVIDVGTEWRSFGNSDKNKNNTDPSRVGAAEDPLLDGGELSTRVSDLGNGLDLPWTRWQHRSSVMVNWRTFTPDCV
eukprot:m.74519 g.74519  ORF g.74519 m.74519 type:complete len:113 (-) comp14364_c0_seq4:969-1307(-)